ncbi:P-loop containing nucleoside triphosphate hydrolase protein [Ascobolus immersus RN42]|uniref:RNA helicase n=1 Tax=Ascobolus immersus RN42 TaxID=1160509 RepID=A0A3N4IPI3_ASCIM|nr:P-loop containing nucleoside triphosphate hydrolase protein [Ascobolus immersus RN42]
MVTKPFVPRQRKQKKTVKKHHDPTNTDPEQAADNAAKNDSNSNVEVIIPLTTAEKAEKRKRELAEEMKADAPKMSSKKAKRLNKYIETKLRKEEKAQLIEQLQETRVDTSLFRSSKSLGAVKQSKREKLSQALREEKGGIHNEENKELIFGERIIPTADMHIPAPRMKEPTPPPPPRKVNKNKMEVTEHNEEMKSLPIPPPPAPVVPKPQVTPAPAAVGSGLKRPLELDENGRPILPTIKRAKKTRAEPSFTITPGPSSKKAVPWSFKDKDSGSSEEEEDSDEEMDSEDDSEDSDDRKQTSEDEDDSSGSDAGTSDEDGEDDDDDEHDSAEEDSEEEDSDEEMTEVPRLKKGTSEKANAFKEWARQQRNAVMDGGVADAPVVMPVLDKSLFNLHKKELTPPPELFVPKVDRKVYSVTVNRSEDIQTARLRLPVVSEEQKIMEAIHTHDCVVLCGETGSGKTTQVPQFLFESGYGSLESETPGIIGVTQPRRVAAVSMAKRVGEELGDAGDRVAYQIRFEATVKANTAIKFMTDGVLLRELSEDFLLTKYSAIIIDEAHERSINTDILIGVVSRILKLRKEMSTKDKTVKPLKLIIMSATLRVSDFTENRTLFKEPPPLLKAEARQHPVTVHFSRRTPTDYVEEAYKKICKIHRKLPPGGILVFLTGQNEINQLLKKLRQQFPPPKDKHFGGAKKEEATANVKILAKEAAVETEDIELGAEADKTRFDIENEESDDGSDQEDDLGFAPEDQNLEDTNSPLHVLPLYSLLPTKDQLKVFDPPPEGSRLCVLSTNVAETSLTIPNIRYVVDCGRAKERNYDKTTGVQSFDIGWISKASASQRAGRSGRTGPGHCYRLYSSAIYESEFPQFSEPEILRMPIEGIVLQMKSMNIDTVINFPFPTPPDRDSLRKAEKLLSYLGAINNKGTLTDLGRTMSIFPLSPRFAKILIIGQQHGCLPYVIAVVAALSVGEIFLPEHQLGFQEDNENEDENTPQWKREKNLENAMAEKKKAYYRAQRQFSKLDPNSDALKLLSVVCAYEYEKDKEAFCSRSFVRLKAMEETHKLRRQISEIVRTNCPGVLSMKFEPKLAPPSELQVKALKQILATGFLDQMALRADLANPPLPDPLPPLSKTPIYRTPYLPLFPVTSEVYSSSATTLIYPHPTSILSTPAPDYVVYTDLIRSATGRVRMRPLTTISPKQIVSLAKGTGLLTYSKPLEGFMPKVEKDGKQREVWVNVSIGAGQGRKGWSLGARKVIQKKEGGVWVTE